MKVMRSIPRHWPRSAPRGDYRAFCDICGVAWQRSKLRRDGAGRLVCPDEGEGLDERTLDRMNSSLVRAVQRRRKVVPYGS